MSRHTKTSRRTRQDSAGTTAEFIHPPAFPAVKVVMVRLACHLVTSGLARQRMGSSQPSSSRDLILRYTVAMPSVS